MKGRIFVAVALGLAVAAGVSCTLILGGGGDYYVVDGGGTTSGSGGHGTTSTTSSGTTSSSATSSTSTGGSGGSGGSGGGIGGGDAGDAGDAGTSCLVEAGACEAGMRCTLLDFDATTGATHCVPISDAAVGMWGVCGNDDSLCPADTLCDSNGTGVCKPFCASIADCSTNAKCIGFNLGNGTIQGIHVCTAHCKPDDGDPPCPPGTTCQHGFDFDCVASQGREAGAPCPGSVTGDCAPGLTCDDQNVCVAWCALVDASSPDCADGGVCKQCSNGGVYDGTEYGCCQ